MILTCLLVFQDQIVEVRATECSGDVNGLETGPENGVWVGCDLEQQDRVLGQRVSELARREYA